MSLLEQFFTSLPHEITCACCELLDFFAPYNLDIYATGGGVRDLFFLQNPKDLDLEIHAITPEKFDSLMQKIGAKGVGKSFFVYKWRGIDLSLPRRENKIAQGHRGFKVMLAKTPKEAALRRDFTMNALMLNLRTGELLDFFGALEDIKNRSLRIVNEKTFPEDSLRLLRAARFCAQLDCDIFPPDLPLLRSMDIGDLSSERIWLEMSLLLRAPHILKGIDALRLTALDEKLFKKPIDSATYARIKTELTRAKSRENRTPTACPHLLPLYLLWQFHFLSLEKILRTFPAMSLKEQRFLRLQKRIPRHISERFLVGLSCQYPLNEWLGLYDSCILEQANSLGIALQSFTPSTTPSELLAQGFTGKTLGDEWRKRRRAEVMKFAR